MHIYEASSEKKHGTKGKTCFLVVHHKKNKSNPNYSSIYNNEIKDAKTTILLSKDT